MPLTKACDMTRFLCVLLVCATWSAARAACPGERDDGKQVKVTGRIVTAARQNGKYFFELKECRILVQADNDAKGACKTGKTLTATGTFYLCDWLSECYDEDTDMDAIEASRISCR
jgi:hypothetical protein